VSGLNENSAAGLRRHGMDVVKRLGLLLWNERDRAERRREVFTPWLSPAIGRFDLGVHSLAPVM